VRTKGASLAEQRLRAQVAALRAELAEAHGLVADLHLQMTLANHAAVRMARRYGTERLKTRAA
jgi:hypothetical protein